MDETKVTETTTTVEDIMETGLSTTTSTYDLESCVDKTEDSCGHLGYILGGMAIGAAVCGIVGLIHSRRKKKEAMRTVKDTEDFEDDFDDEDFIETETVKPENNSGDESSKK